MTSKKRILIIDDNVDQLDVNRIILESEGYEVFMAIGGKKALGILSEIAPPDLILLDF